MEGAKVIPGKTCSLMGKVVYEHEPTNCEENGQGVEVLNKFRWVIVENQRDRMGYQQKKGNPLKTFPPKRLFPNSSFEEEFPFQRRDLEERSKSLDKGTV